MQCWARTRARLRPGGRRFGIGMTVTALVAAMATAVAAPTVTTAVPPPVPQLVTAHGLGTLTTHATHLHGATTSRALPTATKWPTTSSATAVLTGTRVRLGATSVWAQRAAASPVRRIGVHVLDHSAAEAAGVPGVVFTATAEDHGGRVRLGMDYAGFAGAYGGNYGAGLGVDRLPACALTTPALAGCRTATPLPSRNDPSTHSVSADVALPDGTSSSAVVLAVAPTSDSDGGPAGTYSASTLSPSATWAGGGSSGSFTYDYPITLPPAVSTLVPSVSLDYDSGSVDGQTASTQAQASWVGDGWSTPEAFIEQSFVPCSDSPEGSAAPAADGRTSVTTGRFSRCR